MLSIRQVYKEEDLLILGKMKMELMRYHLEYAAKLGIDDKELLQYTLDQALSTTGERDNYLFYADNEPIGMAQVEEQISYVDNLPIFSCMVFILNLMHVTRALEAFSFGIYVASIKSELNVNVGITYRHLCYIKKPALGQL